jgi:hypothetical protein
VVLVGVAALQEVEMVALVDFMVVAEVVAINPVLLARVVLAETAL